MSNLPFRVFFELVYSPVVAEPGVGVVRVDVRAPPPFETNSTPQLHQ
ncbi:MAG: hypothetical protein GY903_03580 [Fuerstiella sp.]|nr:hypothetical protein [Fuerstiella sp.]